ncbi:MAG: Methanol oxidation protein [Chthoniobacteraceae bacterium]|nr:Methanol oxidation protein [Chthoniobacteraceae bacterium]
MKAIAENIWLLRFPLRLLGADVGRAVTVIRLRTGELFIHSSAPFTSADVSAIRALGTPRWLVEAALYHDTYAAAGHAAFPDLLYLAPPGFAEIAHVPSQSLENPPAAWIGELEVLRLEGMPKAEEHVFFHRPSRTLIVGDLLFNIAPDASGWTRLLLRVGAGLKRFPGMSRVFRRMIKDRDAFSRSTRAMMKWDFKRIIVAHGEMIESGGKKNMADALHAAGF